MRKLIFIVLLFASLGVKAQVAASYLRIYPRDTVATPVSFPANTGGLYLNNSTGYLMYKDAFGYHKLKPGGGGGGGGGGAGSVTNVSGTAGRVTVATGTTTPVIDISSTFEALLGKVASPLSQFAATTSAQLIGVLSDEVGTGPLHFGAPVGANTTFAGNHTLSLTDVAANKSGLVRITGSSASNFTVPLNSTVAMPQYSTIGILNQSTDTITVVWAVGVTHNDGGYVKIPPRGSGLLYKYATDSWDLYGTSPGGGGPGGIADCQMVTGTFTTNKTMTLADVSECSNAGFWTFTGTSNANLTVPLFASEAFEAGTTFSINNQSIDDVITVVFTSGITGGGQSFATIPAGETGLLYNRGTNVWDLLGTKTQLANPVGSATLNFASIAANGVASLAVTVTGAVVGDICSIGVPAASMTSGLIYTSYVSATNTVTVQCHNSTGAAIDPASGLFRATVFH